MDNFHPFGGFLLDLSYLTRFYAYQYDNQYKATQSLIFPTLTYYPTILPSPTLS